MLSSHIPKFFASADAVGEFFILDRCENGVALGAHFHFVASEYFGCETLELAEAVHFLDVLAEEGDDSVEDVNVDAREPANLVLLPDIPEGFFCFVAVFKIRHGVLACLLFTSIIYTLYTQKAREK